MSISFTFDKFKFIPEIQQLCIVFVITFSLPSITMCYKFEVF